MLEVRSGMAIAEFAAARPAQMKNLTLRFGLVSLLASVSTHTTPASLAHASRSGEQPLASGGAETQGKVGHESFDKLKARAEAAMEADRIPESIQLYNRATKLRPNWSEGWWHLGTLLFDSARFGEARDAFLHFLASERKQPGPGFLMLGLTEFELKHYEKALAALEGGMKTGLGTDPGFARNVLLHDAELNTLFQKPEIALQRLTLAANRIAARHPEGPKDAVFSDRELLDEFGVSALQMQRLVSNLAPEKIVLVRQAGRAQALIALQDRVGAAAEFETLLAQFAAEPGVNYMYGVFLLKEHPSQAAGAFRRELEVSPSHVPATIQLALRSLETAEYEQGLAYAKQAVGLAPGSFVAHLACGRLYLALGQTDAGLQETRIAVKLAPGSPDAHFALSRALADAGHNEEAARERAEFERLKALSDAANE